MFEWDVFLGLVVGGVVGGLAGGAVAECILIRDAYRSSRKASSMENPEAKKTRWETKASGSALQEARDRVVTPMASFRVPAASESELPTGVYL